jgi:hypothetical protein
MSAPTPLEPKRALVLADQVIQSFALTVMPPGVVIPNTSEREDEPDNGWEANGRANAVLILMTRCAHVIADIDGIEGAHSRVAALLRFLERRKAEGRAP